LAFRTPVDIAQRACQWLGEYPITTFGDDSRQAGEIRIAYDNLRLSELSRHTWQYSIRRARVRPLTRSSQIWTPPLYNGLTQYTTGQCVTYTSSAYSNPVAYPWILQAPSAIGLQPDISPQWSHMFSSLVADVFDNGATYAAGEVALIPPAWSNVVQYQQNAIVVDSSGIFWVSLANLNTDNTPATSPTWWVAWTPPSSGVPVSTPPLPIVYQQPPSVYLSTANNNGPLAPVLATVLPSASPYWTLVGGTVAQLTILWPIGSGPINSGNNYNLYPLPFGWLRPSIYFAKDTSTPWLGALYGSTDSDDRYTYYGNYFSTTNSRYNSANTFIDLNFIADIADVTVMPPLFCESLAIRLARDLDGVLTESKNQTKLKDAYKQITGEAMRIDAIIQGTPTEPMDEFLSVRF
jgi:hypothetical protein